MLRPILFMENGHLYLSVSQIKNMDCSNQLPNRRVRLNSFFELEENMVLTTRSGTIGVALSTNHIFNFDENLC